MAESIFNYLIKVGLVKSNNLSQPIKINDSENEYLFNEILADQNS
jgi:hypothetical protein